MRVSLRYGAVNLPDINVTNGATVGDVTNDFRSSLGLPESVDVMVNGSGASMHTVLNEGDRVSYEKKACNKA